MSYTMTLDMPEKTAAYVRRSPRLVQELNAIIVAVVATRMQNEQQEEIVSERQKPDFSEFFGKAKLKGDAVAFQRAIRDEW